METMHESPYRKWTFWFLIAGFLFSINSMYMDRHITIYNKPLKTDISHLQQNQGIMKEDLKHLEKNYEQYAQANLEISRRMETLLINIYKDKK